MPNWMSYSGEGCSLSFHIPPVFHGSVLWLEKGTHLYRHTTIIIIIIRNKSNGIQLFKDKRRPETFPPRSVSPREWIRYISRSEMAMEDYCGDDELEPCIYIENFNVGSIKECGVHVIAGKLDSFEESAAGRDKMMPPPPLYHLLPHPHCGSITASTPKQWSDFLFAKLQNHNLDLKLYGKNTYFL
jgi:leucine-rich repeat protein SHOC2